MALIEKNLEYFMGNTTGIDPFWDDPSFGFAESGTATATVLSDNVYAFDVTQGDYLVQMGVAGAGNYSLVENRYFYLLCDSVIPQVTATGSGTFSFSGGNTVTVGTHTFYWTLVGPLQGDGAWGRLYDLGFTGVPSRGDRFYGVKKAFAPTDGGGGTDGTIGSVNGWEDIGLLDNSAYQGSEPPALSFTEVDAIATNFDVVGADLNTIFAGLSGLTPTSNTGYKVNGTDLAQLFAPLAEGSATTTTGYDVGGSDLNTIFAGRGTL